MVLEHAETLYLSINDTIIIKEKSKGAGFNVPG